MPLIEAIKEYISKRGTDRLEKFDKDTDKVKQSLQGDELAEFELQQYAKRVEEEKRYTPAVWLSDAAVRAKQISLVTHALKYTHSDAKGTSLIASTRLNASYVSSAAVGSLTADVVGNAAALDVANLLLLEAEGKQLLDYIAAKDSTPLDRFGTAEQVETWMLGFAKALESSEPASHSLAKQLYFPVASGKYHLLAPLSATSFHQALYERIQFHRFSEDAKERRDFKKKGLYAKQPTRDFPNLAVQTFGGTKPQNISLLNSKRGGKIYLFNTQPPSWKTEIKPPASSEYFWKQYRYRIRNVVKELQNYLEKVRVSGANNMRIREKRSQFIALMVDELHSHAANVWQLPAGWSGDSLIQLTLAERCWLDPKSTEEDIIQARAEKAWCDGIAKRFAHVLAKEIQTEKLIMADDEQSHFAKQISSELQTLKLDLEELE